MKYEKRDIWRYFMPTEWIWKLCQKHVKVDKNKKWLRNEKIKIR